MARDKQQFEMVTLSCDACGGEKFCPRCAGSGQVATPGNAVADVYRAFAGTGQKMGKCLGCKGSGVCRQCDGQGEYPQRRAVLPN